MSTPTRRKSARPKPKLIPKVYAIDELLKDPANARRHPERNIEAIRASLRRFGQRKPLVRDETGVIVAGNGTIEAARLEGWEWIEAVDFPGPAAEARAYAIADNRTGELAEWDIEVLSDQIGTLDATLLDGIGFTPEEIADLLASLPGDPLDPSRPSGRDVEPRFSDETIIEAAFEHYRKNGFPFPAMKRHEQMQQINALAALRDDQLRTSSIAYHVADGNHPARYSVAVDGRVTPMRNFERDDRLRLVLGMIIADGGTITDAALIAALAWARNGQLAAQFRPAFALWYMRRFCKPNGAVLDTSAGWGGRLIGYAASAASEYVGIDPSSQAVAGNRRMIDDLAIAGAQIVQSPAEDVQLADIGGRAHFDFAITSPPYFGKERYADEPTQSFMRYTEGDDWRDGFLRPMLALQYAALKPGATSVINIADVKMSKNRFFPLVDWTVEDAKSVGFEHAATEQFDMPRVPGRGEKPTASEPVLIFRKPKSLRRTRTTK